MQIDANAPIRTRQEITIAAPVEKVWTAQADLERWPEWQPDVSSVTLTGELAVESVFRWKAKGVNITSTLGVVEPNRRIGWTGRSIGMRAVHIWAFEPQGDATRVICEESLSGWIPRLMKIFTPDFLEKSMAASLQTLKDYVERSP
jgi:uncharacterized membrane protein